MERTIETQIGKKRDTLNYNRNHHLASQQLDRSYDSYELNS